jgi:hypothetical protein
VWAGQSDLIIGRKGSGKTALAKRLLREREAAGVYCLVRDPLVEYGSGPSREILPAGTTAEEAARAALLEGEAREGAPVCLLLEEVDLDLDPRAPLRSSRWLHWLCQYGRHADVSLIAVARIHTALHPDLRQLASRLWVGRMGGDLEIRWLRSWLSGLAEAGEVDRVRSLRAGEFICISLT